MDIDNTARSEHERWLRELTVLPTAAGRESRVIAWIEAWVAQRDDLVLERDDAGNLVVRMREERGGGEPIYFTAHLDHPAFVVDRVLGPATVQMVFRGGVMDEYFGDAEILIHTRDDTPVAARITQKIEGERVAFKFFETELAGGSTDVITGGDVATWTLPAQEIIDGVIHTNACDDLAAVAAALSAFDVLRTSEREHDVRLLFTRAEEIGFVGAIAACKLGTLSEDARVIALENSRSFADSPIGGGPIVRVGDRMSTFSPSLTSAIAKRAEDVSGGSAHVLAVEKNPERKWRWQRKLMAGGACEASVFCAYGHEATCLCLPLGNYHNMGDLDAVQAGTNTSRPRVGREHIALSDYAGLVDLLVACGESLPRSAPMLERLEKLHDERSFVLAE